MDYGALCCTVFLDFRPTAADGEAEMVRRNESRSQCIYAVFNHGVHREHGVSTVSISVIPVLSVV